MVSLLSGCEIGYRIDSNSVSWVHWNEGTGKVVQPLEQASPSDFRSLGKYHGIAGDLVYFKSMLIPAADAESFEVLSETYSKDAKNVYFQGRRVIGARSISFTPISLSYGIDESSVYFRSTRIKGAVPKEFDIPAFEASKAYSCYLVADIYGCTEEYRSEGT
jgi:hypothetical protein